MFHYRTVAVGVPIESAYLGHSFVLFLRRRPLDSLAPLIAMTLLSHGRHRDV